MPYLAIIPFFIVYLFIFAVIVYLVYLVIKALKKYLSSSTIRKEKNEVAKTLGEAIKRHRLEAKMNQEFVAEAIGVSRQAVSKWESGISDPSTSNLYALAKIFDMEADELLKEANN